MSGVPPLPDEALLEESWVDIRGFRLRLRIWGDRTKPLVFLLHGGRDHGRSWDWTVNALIEEYCCAVPDLRGHGDSDWPQGGGYDAFDFVADTAFVVEHLVSAGFEAPFHFIGHSLGGNILLSYAAAQPHRVRSLIAIEGLGFSQKSYDAITEKSTAERLGEGIAQRLKVATREPRVFRNEDDGIARMRALHKNLSVEQADHLARHGLRKVEGGYRWKYDPGLAMSPARPVPPSEYGPVHGAIEAPVLLMYGKASWASSPAEDGRLDAFRNAELIEFDDAGHWLHHDRFDVFAAAIRRFLEGQS